MDLLIIKNNKTILNWESKSSFTKYKYSDTKCERFLGEVIKNNRLKRFIITLLGSSLYFKEVFAATKGIDALGWKLLGLIRIYAYWILLLWCIVEIIRAGLNGDSKKTFPILMKYLIIFASMYLVPELFNAIKDAF